MLSFLLILIATTPLAFRAWQLMAVIYDLTAPLGLAIRAQGITDWKGRYPSGFT